MATPSPCTSNDEHLHDHPFGFKNTIVAGGYQEHVAQTIPNGPLAYPVIERLPDTTHKLVHRLGRPCWTLIEPGWQ